MKSFIHYFLCLRKRFLKKSLKNFFRGPVLTFHCISFTIVKTNDEEGGILKIEKIDENQIRCTLTREDLARRNMRISELAYGSEKARGLFQDMMHQARMQYGFEPGDIPIMVEAVPMNSECLVLVITKVEDPEELDTRFSNFSPFLDIPAESSEYDYDMFDDDEGEDFFSVFSRIREASFGDSAPFHSSKVLERVGTNRRDKEPEKQHIAVFSFPTLREVTELSRVITTFYNGDNTLYAEEGSEKYYLLLHAEEDALDQFVTVCARLTEYGKNEQKLFSHSTVKESYLEEHCNVVIAHEAVQRLSKM